MNPRDPLPEPLPPLMTYPSPGSVDAADPLKQFRILYLRRWQVIRIFVGVVIMTTLGVFALKPSYRSTATVMIEATGAKVVAIDEVYTPDVPAWNVSDFQNTQIEVLRSRMIADKVFTALKLEQYPEYQLDQETTGLLAEAREFLAEVRNLLRASAPTGDHGRAAAVDALIENIRVEAVPLSSLVNVHAESDSAELSAKIANSVVQAYVDYDRQARGGIADEASGWLGERLGEVKADLERSEKALQAFYESEQLVNVGGSGARGLVEDEITDNSRSLREARNTRASLENVYHRITAAGSSVQILQEIPQIAQEPLVQTTKRLFLEAQSELQSLSSRYGAKHPKMVAAQARMQEATEALRQQVLLAADGIRSQYEIARNTESSLASVVQASRSQVQGLDRNNNQLQILQRDVESNRKLYDTFLQRSKETDIAGRMDIGKVRIVEAATVPKKPFKPRKLLWIATSALLGLFLGLATALLLGFLDDTIKVPPDLEQATAVPVLTVLPRVRSVKNLASLELDEPNSVYSEGIRTLRTSLLLADTSRKRHRILVTSAVPGEGKSNAAMNLAIAMGQVERVLLIDVDLRKPTIGRSLKLPGEKGIVDLITGQAPVQACIQRFERGNIDVLTCGKPPPNPLELVSSERFANLIAELAARYDRVIIDSPPCQPVSDALLLSRCADGVLFMVKADSTPRRLVASVIQRLRQSRAPLIGAVLNEADTRRQSGFASGYYYYKGGYGSYTASSK